MVLHEAHSTRQASQTRRETGKVKRKCKSGVVDVSDTPTLSRKKLIEQAYQTGKNLGLAVWAIDQAGPFQTVPYPGHSWERQGHPQRQPHEYIRNDTVKLITLFHPADGQLRSKGIASCTNAVLHGWLKHELRDILAKLPEPDTTLTAEDIKAILATWTAGLTSSPTVVAAPTAARLLPIPDNLQGHVSPAFVLWLFDHGIISLYTPWAGSG